MEKGAKMSKRDKITQEKELLKAIGELTTEEGRRYYRAISALGSIVAEGATSLSLLADVLHLRFSTRDDASPIKSVITKDNILRQLTDDGIMDLLKEDEFIQEDSEGNYLVSGAGFVMGWTMHIRLLTNEFVSPSSLGDLLSEVVCNNIGRDLKSREFLSKEELALCTKAVAALMSQIGTLH